MHAQSNHLNHSMNNFASQSHLLLANGTTAPRQTSEKTSCDSFYGLTYFHYGLHETVFWSIASLLITTLNAYDIYKRSNAEYRRALYHVFLNILLASNIFAGMTVLPLFVYYSFDRKCLTMKALMACCIFNLVSTFLSTALVAINRLVIVTSVTIEQQNFWHKHVTTAKSYLIYFTVATVSSLLTLLRAYEPKVGSKILAIFCGFLALAIIVILNVLLKKVRYMSRKRRGCTELSPPELRRFKESVLRLRLLVSSITVCWIPIAVIFILVRVFGLQSQPQAMSLAIKACWLRPLADPLCQIFIHNCGMCLRRTDIVDPVDSCGDHSRAQLGRTVELKGQETLADKPVLQSL